MQKHRKAIPFDPWISYIIQSTIKGLKRGFFLLSFVRIFNNGKIHFNILHNEDWLKKRNDFYI